MANERLTLQIDTVTTGEQSVNKLSDSLNKVVSIADRTRSSLGTPPKNPFESFPSQVKQFVQDPLAAAESTATTFLSSFGTAGAITGGLAVGLGAIAGASLAATRSLADLGIQTQAISLKTGLSTKEVGQFGFAAKAAGSDIDVFQTAMRKLSLGLTEGGEEGKKASEALRTLGVSSRTLDGNLRPMGEIFEQIGAGLSQITSPAERNTLAVQLFGRAGIELIPTLVSLNANIARAKELGVGLSDEELTKFNVYKQRLVEIDSQWDILARKFKEGIAGTITLNFIQGTLDFLNGKTGGPGPVSDLRDPRRMGPGLLPAPPGLPPEYGSIMARVQSSIARGSARADAFNRSQLATPEGIQAEIERLTTEIRNTKATIGPGIGAESEKAAEASVAADEARINSLKESLKSLNEQEAKYQATLEKIREAKKAGMPYLVLGSGRDQVVVTSQEQADFLKKSAPHFAPSLMRPGETMPLDEKDPSAFSLGMYKPGFDLATGAFIVDTKAQNKAANETAAAVGRGMDEFREKWQANSLKESSAQIASVRDLGERQARLAGIGAGPGDEVKVAGQQLAIRQAALDKEKAIVEANKDLYDLTGERYRLDKEAQDSTLQYLTTLREEYSKQKDVFSSTVVQGFDAMTQRFGRSIATRDFFTGLLRGQLNTVVGNAAGALFESEPFQQIKTGISSVGGSGIAGQFLKGTIFGSNGLDASKVALMDNSLKTDANTVATAALTNALSTLRASAVSPTGGGGGLPSGAGVAAASGAGISSGAGTIAIPGPSGGWNVYTQAGVNPNYTGTQLNSGTFGSGLGSFASGNALSILFGTGSGTGASLSSQIGAGVGMAGTLAAGGLAIASGLSQGGVGGDLKAAGGGIGVAATLTSNIAKLVGATGPLLSAIPIIGSIAAMALPLIGGLFNGPQQRATAISQELQQNQYLAPTALNVIQSSNGTFTDFNARGMLRGSNFSAVPMVAEPFIWQQTHGFLGGPPTYYNVPGGQTSQFGAPVAAPAPPVIIQAMDVQSFAEFAQRNHSAIGDAAAANLQSAHSRLATEVQRAAAG